MTKVGRLLLTESEQNLRWKEHFEEVLNQLKLLSTSDFGDTVMVDSREVYEGNINLEQVQHAVTSLMNNKAPCMDEISAEMLRHGKETVAEHLAELFNMIWQDMEVPEDWKKGVIIKLPKKGSLKDCNNWQGITLLSTPSKVFSRVLLNRLQGAVDNTLQDEQAGFRKGRSCTEQIFTLRSITEQSLEHQQDLILNFINFKKAFDSVHRPTLWKILTYYGIPDRFINIFKALYDNSSCCIKTASGYTQSSLRLSQRFDKAASFHHSSSSQSSTLSCAKLWTSWNTASSGRSGTA